MIYLHVAHIMIAPTTIKIDCTKSVHITADSPPTIVNTDVMARSIIIEMYKDAVLLSSKSVEVPLRAWLINKAPA